MDLQPGYFMFSTVPSPVAILAQLSHATGGEESIHETLKLQSRSQIFFEKSSKILHLTGPLRLCQKIYAEFSTQNLRYRRRVFPQVLGLDYECRLTSVSIRSIGEGQKGTPKKGTGRKTSANVMTNRFPSPPTPFYQNPPPPPLPLMSSEAQKRGKLVREVTGPKDKTMMGVGGTLCHDIFCPVPFPASPSDLHRF